MADTFLVNNVEGLNASSKSEAVSSFVVNHVAPVSRPVRQSAANRVSRLEASADWLLSTQQKRQVRSNIGIFAKGGVQRFAPYV
jgi:hypothetical protein